MTKQETLELISYGESQTLEFKKTTGELKEICRWETEISKSKTIDDLDHQEIIITLEEAILRGRLVDPKTRDIMSVLKGLNLIREGKLTNAAVALFIKEDRALPEYTQLHLKMARFKGNDKEAIANAICHREYEQGGGNVSIAIYDNRLEISSSGGLHFGLTAEDLFKEHESKSWNPLISSVFYKRGLIETWGRGTLIIKEQIEQAGLVSPSYTITNNSVTLVFSPERQVHSGSVSVNLDARQQYIANIFFHNPNQTYSLKDLYTLVSQKIDINKRSFKAELQNLKNLKLISTEGRGAGARWGLNKKL